MIVKMSCKEGLEWIKLIHGLFIYFFILQYFLNPTVVKEPVPVQLQLIAQELLVPLLAFFHHIVKKVTSSCFILTSLILGAKFL